MHGLCMSVARRVTKSAAADRRLVQMLGRRSTDNQVERKQSADEVYKDFVSMLGYSAKDQKHSLTRTPSRIVHSRAS